MNPHQTDRRSESPIYDRVSPIEYNSTIPPENIQAPQSFVKAHMQYLQSIQTMKYRTQELRDTYTKQMTDVHLRYLSRMERLIQKTIDILIQEDPEDDYEKHKSSRSRGNSLNNSQKNSHRDQDIDYDPKTDRHKLSRSNSQREKSRRNLVRSNSDNQMPPKLPPPLSKPTPPKKIPHSLSQSTRAQRSPSPSEDEGSMDKVYQLKYNPKKQCYEAETVQKIRVLSSSAPESKPDLTDALLKLTELNRQQSRAIKEILMSPRN